MSNPLYSAGFGGWSVWICGDLGGQGRVLPGGAAVFGGPVGLIWAAVFDDAERLAQQFVQRRADALLRCQWAAVALGVRRLPTRDALLDGRVMARRR